MGLNLDRVQGTAEEDAKQALNDACQDPGLATLERTHPCHRRYLLFLPALPNDVRISRAPSDDRQAYARPRAPAASAC